MRVEFEKLYFVLQVFVFLAVCFKSICEFTVVLPVDYKYYICVRRVESYEGSTLQLRL